MNTGIKTWVSALWGAFIAASAVMALPAHAADGAVCLYEHADYLGTQLCADADNNWVGGSWNDKASSVKVRAGYKVELFENSNYGGRSITLTSNSTNLVPLNFNDAASSFRVSQTTTSTKSAKRGIAYDLQGSADLQALAPGVSWWYNWGLKPGAGVPSDYRSRYTADFIPMLWNGDFNASEVESYLRANPGIKYLLVMNEPNLTEQSNLSPQRAAQIWPNYERVAANTGVQIVGPAITWGTMSGYADPIAWLDAFYAAYRSANGNRDPRIDYLGFHWYDYGLKEQLDRLGKFKKPFWVTEFANWHNGDGSAQIDSVAKQKAQMKEMVALCESRSDVFRYAWFTGRWNNDTHYSSLLSGNGQLTELGSYYLSLPH